MTECSSARPVCAGVAVALLLALALVPSIAAAQVRGDDTNSGCPDGRPAVDGFRELVFAYPIEAQTLPDDCTFNGHRMRFFPFQCRANLTIRVDVTSQHNNVAGIATREGRVLAFDAEPSASKQIVWTCPDAGTYAIGAGAVPSNTHGSIRLQVSEHVAAPPLPVPPGRACSPFQPCPARSSCHPIINRCYDVPRREGQPCTAGFACGEGLTCRNSRCAAGAGSLDAAARGPRCSAVPAAVGTPAAVCAAR